MKKKSLKNYNNMTSFVKFTLVACRAICYNAATMEQFEIERKFLILRPSEDYLRKYAEKTEIVQTYLCAEQGKTERVRKRSDGKKTVYTHTVKTRLNAMRRIEDECEISAEEYEELLLRADPERRPIVKQRWVLPYDGQRFEIDVFPFWQRQAYLELELSNERQRIRFPSGIEVIREVTDDRRYTNASLAKEIPAEEAEGDKR